MPIHVYKRDTDPTISGDQGNKAPDRDTATSPSDFIRAQLARGKSPPEIMAEAERVGLTFSRNLVYAVRSANRSADGGRAGTGAAASRSAMVKARPPRDADSGAKPDDALFRKLAVEMGLARARELLDDLEARLRKILEGA